MSLSNKARRRIVIASTSEVYGDEIADAIDYTETVRDTITTFHEVTSPTAWAARSPGQQPAVVVFGATLAATFTLNADEGFKVFRIPDRYMGNAIFHIHWTKSTDAVEATKNVRWRISYTVIDGTTQDAAIVPTVIDMDDTYDDGGTTTRIVYRTPNSALLNLVPGSYLSVQIEAVTPTGVAMVSKPALVNVDLKYDMYINK